MIVLALDIGTSSVKAAILRDGRRLAGPVREPIQVETDGLKVEIPVDRIERAMRRAVAELGPAARQADRIAFDVFSPSFLLMDAGGKALTPIVTHQDRRSTQEAHEIEKHFGRREHLRLTGNRPFPGGIASTSLLWYRRHHPSLLKRTTTIGMLSTYLARKLTDARTIDPGNAAFLGLYDGIGMTGWRRELLKPSGVKLSMLPDVRDGADVAGRLTAAGARRLGLKSGIEVLVGVIDTSAAFYGAGVTPGRTFNSIGTTDVIAICTDRPRPHAKLLSRPVGAGNLHLAVYTIAAGGGSIAWAHRALFPDMSQKRFFALAQRLAGARKQPTVRFGPYLAGDRMSITQRRGSLENLTLDTDREDILHAILVALAERSAEGISLVSKRAKPLRDVFVAGGGRWLSKILHAGWPKSWRFKQIQDAALLGLERLARGD